MRVAPTARRERGVLAALALRSGSAVAVEDLVDLVWGSRAPATVIKTLQTYVSHLRVLLGPDVLVTRPGAYCLAVEPGAVDVFRFEALVAEGRMSTSAGDLEAACDAFRRAIGLWRGPPLTELAEDGGGRAAAARLLELKMTATEDLGDASLALGEGPTLVPELEKLVGDHPLRERLWGQLMVALYRAGRQAEALRAFQRARQRLIEELGVEPGDALRSLEARILAQSPDLGAPVPISQMVAAGPAPLRWGDDAAPEDPFPFETGPVELVGRDDELDSLVRSWKDALVGDRRVVVIAGEPGAGKTRLAMELARIAHRDGGLVLLGRCDEEVGTPYQPAVDALRQCHLALGDAWAESLPPGDRVELAHLLPELDLQRPGDDATSADPQTGGRRLLEAVLSGLAAAARMRPVLLVLDDLHWMKPPGEVMLRHLARADRAPLAVVATCRTTELAPGDPVAGLLADLRSVSNARRLDLSGLSPEGVADYLSAFLGDEPGVDLSGMALPLWRRTRGNPLFVGQLAAQLAEAGVSGFEAGGLDGAGSSLAGLREVVDQRVNRLGPEGASVVGVSSVAGLSVDLAVLARVCELEATAFDTGLRSALRAGLLEETRGSDTTPVAVQFVHEVVRAAVYDSLPPSLRGRLHRHVGDVGATVHANCLERHLYDVAYHYSRAAAYGEECPAATYAIRAGRLAASQYAFGQAVEWFDQAVDGPFGLPVAELGAVMVELGVAQRNAGQDAYRQTLLSAAERGRVSGDPGTVVQAALAIHRGTFSTVGAVDEERAGLYEEALELLGPDDSAERCLLLSHLATELAFGQRSSTSWDLGEEAVAMARRLGSPATLRRVLSSRLTTAFHPATLAERVGILDELAVISRRGQPPGLEQLLNRPVVAMERGDLTGAGAAVELARRETERIGDAHAHWLVASTDATLAAARGQLQLAEEHANAAVDFAGRAGFPDALAYFGPQLLSIRYHQGRLGEVLETVETMAQSTAGSPAYQAALGVVYAEVGRLDQAKAVASDLAAVDLEALYWDPSWGALVVLMAELAAAVADVSAAKTLYGLLVPFRHIYMASTPLWWDSYERPLALLAATLGRLSAAEEHFAAAVSAHRHAGSPCFEARTLLDWADFIERSEVGADRAGRLRDQALGVSEGLGISHLQVRARR